MPAETREMLVKRTSYSSAAARLEATRGRDSPAAASPRPKGGLSGPSPRPEGGRDPRRPEGGLSGPRRRHGSPLFRFGPIDCLKLSLSVSA
mmetsp:Transcript_13944/g.43222  ORF Transcript_13944/g.43222 Transcript_13944/m.43222 type:complete len:91 (+) Transcript_13944:21-293(+)